MLSFELSRGSCAVCHVCIACSSATIACPCIILCRPGHVKPTNCPEEMYSTFFFNLLFNDLSCSATKINLKKEMTVKEEGRVRGGRGVARVR